MEKEKEAIVAMGVRPTRPEPGYGYIQIGDNVDHDIYTVKSFTEKPNREFAQLFVDSGEFYWNTGMFFARQTTAQEHLSTASYGAKDFR